MQCPCAILSSAACPALQYFSTLSHKRHNFREKKVIENEMRVLIFSTAFEAFFVLKRIELYIVINLCLSSCAVPVILVRF
jgi:hypothetical protein